MAEPIVFISNFRVREGKLEGLRQVSAEMVPAIEGDKPRTVVFQAYLGEDESEVSFVHVFPDAEAMDLHFEGAEERSARGYEYIEPMGFVIYGSPSETALETMRGAAAAGGVELVLKPLALAGFSRFQ